MITYPNVKVNLGLEVIRRREDNYHDLRTLFVPFFGIHDTLEIVTGDKPSLTSKTLFAKYGPVPDVVPEGYVPNLVQAITPDGKVMITLSGKDGIDWDPLKDLTVKAYSALSEGRDLPGIKIFLEKTSPVGAGLGGGSSDAAFALIMINELLSLGLDKAELARVASTLGSDCPFFIYNTPMMGEGRGEVLTPYDLPLPIHLGEDEVPEGARYTMKVIIPEGVRVSTADAYRGIVPREKWTDGKVYPPLGEVLEGDIQGWKDGLVNDFETTVFAKHPELRLLKDSLYESGAVYASMSGSGSALFAIYPIDKN